MSFEKLSDLILQCIDASKDRELAVHFRAAYAEIDRLQRQLAQPAQEALNAAIKSEVKRGGGK